MMETTMTAMETTATVTTRVDGWCYRHARGARDGRDGIDDNTRLSCARDFLFVFN
jgi:hypothetical protein